MGTGIHCKPIKLNDSIINTGDTMKNIAIIGFGNVGQRLANLFTDAGYQVTICSQDGEASKPEYAAAKVQQGIKAADAIALAIPYTAVKETLTPYSEELAGKILIECTNPLNEDWSPLLLGQQTSAAEEVAALLPETKVVKAFNTIFADVMAKEHHDRAGLKITAFVAGNDTEAKSEVLTLVEKAGLAPLDTGDLSSARYLEAMAHLNIKIAVGQGGGTQAAFIYHQA